MSKYTSSKGTTGCKVVYSTEDEAVFVYYKGKTVYHIPDHEVPEDALEGSNDDLFEWVMENHSSQIDACIDDTGEQFYMVGDTKLPVSINTVEEAHEFLSECIENGYDYGLCVHEVAMNLNVPNSKCREIANAMARHSMDRDPEYLEFRIELENILR